MKLINQIALVSFLTLGVVFILVAIIKGMWGYGALSVPMFCIAWVAWEDIKNPQE